VTTTFWRSYVPYSDTHDRRNQGHDVLAVLCAI